MKENVTEGEVISQYRYKGVVYYLEVNIEHMSLSNLVRKLLMTF